MDLETVIKKSEELFENKERANEWMHKKQYYLGGVTPMSMCETEEGRQEVYYLIGRIQHGVLS